jgi:hypothetical protein
VNPVQSMGKDRIGIMEKLDATQVKDYFNIHLPYRMRIMLAHYKMTHDSVGNGISWAGDPGRLDACFIASLVTTRLFLNVIGVGKDKDAGTLGNFREKPDDVTVDDLGGTRLDPTTLPRVEHDMLFDFVKMADKASAHFTIPIPHDWTKTHDVILLIHHYVKLHLYDPTGNTILPIL